MWSKEVSDYILSNRWSPNAKTNWSDVVSRLIICSEMVNRKGSREYVNS